MAFNCNPTMNNDETKSLNAGNSAYSYDEVFPALPAGMALGSKTKAEVMPPVQNFSNQMKNLRINSSDVTTV